MPVKLSAYRPARRVPVRADGVVVHKFVDRQSQVCQCCAIKLGDLGVLLQFSSQIMEDLHANAVPVELAGREHLGPAVDAVFVEWPTDCRFISERNFFVREDIPSLPFRHALAEPSSHKCFNIIFRPRCAEPSLTFDLRFAGFCLTDLPVILKYYCVQLLTHLPGQGLGLDIVPTNDAPTVEKRALCRSILDGAFALLARRIHNFEPAESRLQVRNKPQTNAITTQCPVRRQWYRSAAIRAGNRACPKPVGGDSVDRKSV